MIWAQQQLAVACQVRPVHQRATCCGSLRQPPLSRHVLPRVDGLGRLWLLDGRARGWEDQMPVITACTARS